MATHGMDAFLEYQGCTPGMATQGLDAPSR
jgi:hypothetical protein